VQTEHGIDLRRGRSRLRFRFVVGVMSQISGDPRESLPPSDDREFAAVERAISRPYEVDRH
jgi:hypothetical protein